MDDASLRTLIEGALKAQQWAEAADQAAKIAEKAFKDACVRLRGEADNLARVLNGASIVYGDQIVSVGVTDANGFGCRQLLCTPLLKLRAVEPPVPPPVVTVDVPNLASHAATPAAPEPPKPVQPPLSAGNTSSPNVNKVGRK